MSEPPAQHRPTATASSGASVAVVLVSHDGARWLPSVTEGIRAQTAAPGAVIAVDTGSHDESTDLLSQAFGDVVTAPGSTSYPEAVRLGMERVAGLPQPPEWVWLLHDDTNPDHEALAAMLAVAEERSDVSILGPKLREWPSLRRLLEVGVTITGTGRRELGLERGEYDQGQHDAVREVLAVNTAGMLVRREVLERLDGFEEHLPIFGNDIDFGWRAANAGYRTLVVPQALVFHAEAAHLGIRRTPLTGRHTHYQERRAALFTVLANCRPWALPFTVVRLALGTLLRMLGFFLVRSPGEALDDLAALLSVYARPGQVLSARRERRSVREDDPDVAERVRGLLAPWWLPYRHGLDFISDVFAALTSQAADVADRRRVAAAERDPSSMAARRLAKEESDLDDPDREEDEAYVESGFLVRFLSNPVAVLLTGFVVLTLLLTYPAWGAVSAPGLSPAPDSVADWWRLHLDSWHELGSGTDVPAPPYVLPLALLGSLVGATAAVSLLMVLAVPLAAFGAWRFLRVVGRLVSTLGAPRWLLLVGAAAYALVPVASGAWSQGRLGIVMAALVLPWLAHAALGFADPLADRRWRAAWRVGLLLSLLVAFTPVAWFFALVLGLVVVAAATRIVPDLLQDRSTWGPPALALAVVPVLLLPWWLPALVTGAGAGLLLDAGSFPGARLDDLGLLTGRLTVGGAPAWLGLVVAVLALLALVPRATRIPVLVCWLVAAVAGLLALVLSPVTLSLTGVTEPVGTGFGLVVVQGALLCAVVLGGLGAERGAVPRPVTLVAGCVAAVVPLGGLAWFAFGTHQLDEPVDADIPAYMAQETADQPGQGILVVRGSREEGMSYVVRRGDGVTLGEDEIVALGAESSGLTESVRDLVSRPTPGVVGEIGDRGIAYVVLPAPVDGSVASGLDASGGLLQASAGRESRAWQVARELDPDAVSDSGSWWRVPLVVLQGLALVGVLVQAAPTVRGRRG